MTRFGAAKRTWERLWESRRFKYFIAFAIFVGTLAIVFSEGLMAIAVTSDGWALYEVDEVVGNRTGVGSIFHFSTRCSLTCY